MDLSQPVCGLLAITAPSSSPEPCPGQGMHAFRSERLQRIDILIRTSDLRLVPTGAGEACGYLVNGWAKPAPLLASRHFAQMDGTDIFLRNVRSLAA